MKSKFLLLSTLLLFILSACSSPIEDNPIPNQIRPPETNTQTQISEPVKVEEKTLDKIVLDVPFTSQAPTRNWDPPYDEACEEASMLMVYNFLQGQTSISTQAANQQILDLVDYQTTNNYPIDLTIAQMQEIIAGYYNYQSQILQQDDLTLDNLRTLLSQGTPIIIPVAGQELGNPNFSGDGPPFHVLVVVGYDDNKQSFITHDPGTRKGANYLYPYQTILNNLHDWTGNKSTIKQGTPKAIIFTEEISNETLG